MEKLSRQSPFIEVFRHFKVSRPNSALSFSESLLSGIDFHETIRRIRSLADEGVKLRTVAPDNYNVEPGTVLVFHVHVAWEGNGLRVIEKTDPSSRERFFDSEKATRVIWIHSECVRVIESKLRVYKEYRERMINQMILLHHEFDENDDIFQLSGMQMLDSLNKNTLSILKYIPVNSLKNILEGASENILSLRNIRNVCCNVIAYDDRTRVGKVGDGEYSCRSTFTVKRIKKYLVEKTLETIANEFGSEICKGILASIKINIQPDLNDQFSQLQDDISDEIFPVLKAIQSFLVRAFFKLYDAIFAVYTFVVVLFWSVNVNERKWRNEVAGEIYEVVSEKKDSILKDVLPTIRELCEITIQDLRDVLANVDDSRKKIALPNQENLVKEWKKREVIRDRVAFMEKYPSVLTYIAGTRNEKSFVKVFLDGDHKDAEREFERRSYLEDNPTFQYINVTEDLTLNAMKQGMSLNQIPPSIPKQARANLDGIIKNKKDVLIASYSNIIGLGIDRKKLGHSQFGDACIVLYCLDKDLVPFGEQKLPTDVEGCPVEIREDFIMFGGCGPGCEPVKQGCSIGMPNVKKAGSVGFFVRSTDDASESGFLTAAHVALNEKDFDLSNDELSKSKHEIIHPSSRDSETNTVVGKVQKVLCKNVGAKKIGIDAAYVKVYNPNTRDKVYLQIATESDLPFDDRFMFVTKNGRTTGQTTGILISENYYPCITSPKFFGKFFNFQSCYFIHNHGSLFFGEGDSGAGVFLVDEKAKPVTYKALGIAFAFLKNGGTFVCRIKEITEEFRVAVYTCTDREEEPMDVIYQR